MATMQCQFLQLVLIISFSRSINHHKSLISSVNNATNSYERDHWFLSENGLEINSFGLQIVQDTLLSTTTNLPPKSKVLKSCQVKVNSANLVTNLALLLSGDIASNPGPTRTPKYPCSVCGKGVRWNSKAVSCDECEQWTHIILLASLISRYRIIVKE